MCVYLILFLKTPRTHAHLRFIKVISCHSFIFRGIEAAFEWHTPTHMRDVSTTAAISSNELRQRLAQSHRCVPPYSHILPLLLSSLSSPLLLLPTPLLPVLPTLPFLHLCSFHLPINSYLLFPLRIIANFSLFLLIFLPLITDRSNWPLKMWEINFCARWLHRNVLESIESRLSGCKIGNCLQAMSIITWTDGRKLTNKTPNTLFSRRGFPGDLMIFKNCIICKIWMTKTRK